MLERQAVACREFPRPLIVGGRCQTGKSIVVAVVAAVARIEQCLTMCVTKGTTNQTDLWMKSAQFLRSQVVEKTATGELMMTGKLCTAFSLHGLCSSEYACQVMFCCRKY